MATEPQQFYDPNADAAARRFSSSGLAGAGQDSAPDSEQVAEGGTEVVDQNPSSAVVDSAANKDVRASDATTVAGRVRDAAADKVGAKVYERGAAKLGQGLGVDMNAQNARTGSGLKNLSYDRAKEQFAQGKADKAANRGFREGLREQNKARVARGAGSAVSTVGGELVKDAGKQVAKEVVKDGAKAAATVASKAVPGLGLVTAIDAKGIKNTVQDTARDLANLHLGKATVRAVTGLGKSTALTLFRASYDPWVMGFTGLLSLIVTLLLGTILFFVPNSLNIFERVIVGMVWFLFFVVLAVILAVVVVSTCSGLSSFGLALKIASYVSTTAASANELCQPFSAFGSFGQ